MRFDTKIAIVVREDLATWQRLNVTAFLSAGLATHEDGLVGEEYQDASGVRYLPMFRQPVLVHQGDGAALTRARERAQDRGLAVGVYTEELFRTDNDADNRAAVAQVPTGELTLVGLSVYGPRNQVSTALKGLDLHD